MSNLFGIKCEFESASSCEYVRACISCRLYQKMARIVSDIFYLTFFIFVHFKPNIIKFLIDFFFIFSRPQCPICRMRSRYRELIPMSIINIDEAPIAPAAQMDPVVPIAQAPIVPAAINEQAYGLVAQRSPRPRKTLNRMSYDFKNCIACDKIFTTNNDCDLCDACRRKLI